MSLFGFVGQWLQAERDKRLLAALNLDPARIEALSAMSVAMMQRGSLQPVAAIQALITTISVDDVAMLDTPEGRAVLFEDAIEALPPIVRSRAA